MMWRAKYEKSLAMPTGWQQLPNGRAYCNALNAYFAPWFTKICGYQILKIGGLSAEIQCDLPLRHQISLSEKITENLTALSMRLYKNPLLLRLQQYEQQLAQLKVRLNSHMNLTLSLQQKQLAHLCGKLDSLSPLRVLARGYSITQNQQNFTIRSIKDVNVGEQIKTRLPDGDIISQVIRLEEKE